MALLSDSELSEAKTIIVGLELLLGTLDVVVLHRFGYTTELE